MKKIKFILLLLLSISIWSCDDDDADINVLASETIENITVLTSNDGIDFVITETTEDTDGNEADKATTFSWSEVKGNYNGTILYTVQMDIKGNNFRNGVSLPLNDVGTTQLSKEISNNDLNLAVNQINTALVTSGSALAVDFTTATEFEVRVLSIAEVSNNQVFSEPITINVNAYEKIVIIEPELFIVGSVQGYYGASNWTPSEALAMRYIGDGTTKVFEAYVKATGGDIFKFISNQGANDWSDIIGNYGVIGGAQDGNLENDGGSGNLEITEAGQYYVQVDIDNLTYKLVKMQWGIIGNAAGGWSDEIPMTYDLASNTWEIDTTLDEGELKFRSKNTGVEVYGSDWAFNCGPDLEAWDNAGTPNFQMTAGATSLSIVINIDGTITATGVE